MNRHRSFNDFYQAFALLALHEGISLNYFDNTLDNGTQKQLRVFKKACIDTEAHAIGDESLPLTPKEQLQMFQGLQNRLSPKTGDSVPQAHKDVTQGRIRSL